MLRPIRRNEPTRKIRVPNQLELEQLKLADRLTGNSRANGVALGEIYYSFHLKDEEVKDFTGWSARKINSLISLYIDPKMKLANWKPPDSADTCAYILRAFKAPERWQLFEKLRKLDELSSPKASKRSVQKHIREHDAKLAARQRAKTNLGQPNITVINGEARAELEKMPEKSVHCIVTSPPYWNQRNYGGLPGEIGQEPTVEEYLAKLFAVCHELKRVLRDDGTFFLNLSDIYQNKQLLGIPWRLAFLLQKDGWYWRDQFIWAKRCPMPQSVRDRRTLAHEYILHFTKSDHYYYNADAIAEPSTSNRPTNFQGTGPKADENQDRNDSEETRYQTPGATTRNARSVIWEIPNEPNSDPHFATFPTGLPKTCIDAGCPIGGVVLDPFAGSGTTGITAVKRQRSAILIERNPAYLDILPKKYARIMRKKW